MHDGVIQTEKIRCGTYLIENEKEEETLSSLFNEKMMPALYCLYKEEVAHSKLNSLVEFVEFLRVKEMAHFQKQSSRTSERCY